MMFLDDAYFRRLQREKVRADRRRKVVLLFLAFLLGAGICSGGDLFHNGGTGNCDGCHSKTRKRIATGTSAVQSPLSSVVGAAMLNGGDPSSTCLLCHQSRAGSMQAIGHIVATHTTDLDAAPPVQLTPGGDFGWLKKNYRWSSSDLQNTQNGSRETSPGERHGHNIVASDYGYVADSSNILAPEGDYPAEMLSCVSCHDPHGTYRRNADGTVASEGATIVASGSYKGSPDPAEGKPVGVYRLLAGKGYLTRGASTDLAFTADPPVAVSPLMYNRPEDATDTRVAYGSGMSEWCRNCHKNTHKDKAGHPAGNGAKFTAEISRMYNSYVASGNASGKTASAYSSLVPFETGARDVAPLKALANSDGSVLDGAVGSPNVMCLSCHRVHASGWDAIGRWNFNTPLVVWEGKFPGIDNDAPAAAAQGRNSRETQKALYDRSPAIFASYQRGLCSKCHAKD